MKIPEKLLNNYLQRRLEELEQIDSAIQNKDFATLFKIGHQLKGNGSMYGFPEISNFGNVVETAATNHELNLIQPHLADYQNLIAALSKK